MMGHRRPVDGRTPSRPSSACCRQLQEAGGTPVTSGTVTSTTPNATVSWQVPAPLTAATAYRFRVKATKSSVEAASPWLTLTPDFVAPAVPAVASTGYPEGCWAGGTGTPGSFTVTPPTADVSWVVWRLDDGPCQEVPYSGTPRSWVRTGRQGVWPLAKVRLALPANGVVCVSAKGVHVPLNAVLVQDRKCGLFQFFR
ncbi:hypothetical protein [Saccharothrix luteola]|uniref:hypothetical protein n=1 Tax=Saccharothrix luteola TaxID=2893018 RepID=UPI001E4CD2CA|nr:hypothetical protein [Saccharothrix luteola]MCC8246642.1 hypothetical protein [Saccharothrix luteola]